MDEYDSLMYTGTLISGGAFAVLGVAGYCLNRYDSKPLGHDAAIKLSNQSIELEPGHRASHLAPKGELINSMYGCTTTHEAFMRGLRISETGDCLGVRKGHSYEYISYREVYERAQRVGSSLLKKGVSPNEEGIVGIFAGNSIEWVVMEQACAMFSMVVVPLYDTLGTEAVTFVMKRTNMTLVMADSTKKASSLLANLQESPMLKTIVLTCDVPLDLKQQGKEKNIDILSMQSMEMLGLANIHEPIPGRPDDVVTICFTSGTTGEPKGVVLTHKNFMSVMGSIIAVTKSQLYPTDRHFSYLPLAHIFERIIHIDVFIHGAKIGFMGGSIRDMMADIQILKPTIFAAVPRVLNRLHDKVIQGAAKSKALSTIFHFAYSRKLALLRKGIITRDTVWDKLVFGKIQGMLGGHIRLMFSGSAPLAKEVLDFVRCALGVQIWEGYGQTESCGGSTVTLEHELEGGHVGPPLPCLTIKLIDVPEMNYFVKDNKGEICVRGDCVMREYYKDPQKTAETVDEEGWLLTGDVGRWTANGSLQIIDRRKNIFKLAQGEYVAPDKIETEYMASPLIMQIFVDGDSLKTYVVAIVVPDPEAILPWAKKREMNGDFETLCKGQALKEELMKEIKEIGKEAGLKSFEQVKDIFVCSKQFTLEDGLLTPTFKTKRPALRMHFQQTIDDIYLHNETHSAQ